MANSAVATSNSIRSLAAADDDILSDDALWQVVSSGDLRGLSPAQKTAFYQYKCRELGISPAHQPFQFITFQGKEILYGTKNLAEQLRGLHGVTFHGISFSDEGDLMTYEGFVRTRDGREDYEVGVLAVGGLKGEARANAKMKCLTKFKRRATLSICGAGVPDETEIEAGDRAERRTYPQQLVSVVPDAKPVPAKLVPAEDGTSAHLEMTDGDIVDADTGEIQPPIDTAVTAAETDDDLDGRVKYLRERLGWSAQDVVNDAGENDINLRRREGMVAMVKRLEILVRAS